MTSGPAEDYFPRWLGDDHHIVYDSDSAGKTRVFTFSADASGAWSRPRQVTPDSIVATYPAVSPKGDLIAFIQRGAFSLVEPDGRNVRILADRATLGAPPVNVSW